MAEQISAELVLGLEPRILLDEMSMRLNIEHSGILKLGLCILYEMVCVYPTADSWRVIARNRYSGEDHIFDPVKDFGEKPHGPEEERFDVDSTTKVTIDEESQFFMFELKPFFGNDLSYVTRLALGMIMGILYRFHPSEGWDMIAENQQFPGEPLSLEACRALAA